MGKSRKNSRYKAMFRMIEANGAIHNTPVCVGRQLIALHGDSMRYVHEAKRWLVYDGVRWSIDHNSVQMEKKLRDLGEAYRWMANEVGEYHPLWKTLLKVVKMIEGDRETAIKRRASREPGITIDFAALDNKEYILGCPNGQVDLRCGKLLKRDPENLVTKTTRTKFIPNSPPPTKFLEFLDEAMLGRQDLVEFIQVMLGYCLTGSTREQKMFFLYGPHGSNGKSTLLNIVNAIMGEYSTTTSSQTFTSRAEDNNKLYALASLRGSRLVTASETSRNKTLNEEVMKLLTGGDLISARHPYGSPFRYSAHFKSFMATNHLPRLSNDLATWRRVVIVPFEAEFIPADEMDPSKMRSDRRARFEEGRVMERNSKLMLQLEREYESILGWMVQGAVKWYERGLVLPESVNVSIAKYRKSCDFVGGFLSDRTDIAAESNGAHPKSKFCTVAELFTAYEDWCEAENLEPVTKASFGKHMKANGYINKAIKNHRSPKDPTTRVWMLEPRPEHDGVMGVVPK